MTDKHDVDSVYFQGESLIELARELIEVQGLPGAQLFVLGPLSKHTRLKVVAEGYDGDEINASHVCPGSPGCP